MGLAGQILIDLARRGEAPVLIAPGMRLRGRTLAYMARNMALHLVQRGIGRGALVALRSDDLVVSLASILAAGLLGARWTAAGAAKADLLLDTAPDGQLFPGAVLIDQAWARQPMAEAEGMFPGVAADGDWLVLAGQSFSDTELLTRFREDAEVFDRRASAVVGLGGPEEPEQLLLALSTLYHGGVLVESAEPPVWQAEGVVLVAGRPPMVEACLEGWSGGARFRDLQLWGGAEGREALLHSAFERVTERSFQGVSGPVAEPGNGTPPFDLLDHLFCSIEGVIDAMTFTVPKAGKSDRLTAFLVLEPGADLPGVTNEAKIAALRLGGRAAVPGRFLVTVNLPRRPDGSADRDACRKLVVDARADRRRGKARGVSALPGKEA